MKEFEKIVNDAMKIVLSGGTILYPTDTIWGIGCDATNPEAVRRVYEIKERPDTNAMIVLVNSEKMLRKYVRSLPAAAIDLINSTTFPLTLIFPDAENLPANLINRDGSIAIRIPSDDFCNHLISGIRKPLISTSANLSGKPFPRSFSEINPKIKGLVDLVVPWRLDDPVMFNPSRIIKLDPLGNQTVVRE